MDKDMRAKIVGKARADADFRARLLSDPKGAIAQELGVAIPESLSVEVHEETATTAHLIVPAAGSLTEDELEAAAGGVASGLEHAAGGKDNSGSLSSQTGVELTGVATASP